MILRVWKQNPNLQCTEMTGLWERFQKENPHPVMAVHHAAGQELHIAIGPATFTMQIEKQRLANRTVSISAFIHNEIQLQEHIYVTF